MQYVIKQKQSIYDVALELYGDSSYAVKLVNENPLLLDLDNANIYGITVNYDETIKPTIKYNLVVSNFVIPDTEDVYVSKKGQSIYDLSFEYGYGIENIVEFINLINIESLNSGDVSGKSIYVTKRQNNVTDYLFLQNKKLATNIDLLVFGTEDNTTIFTSEDGTTQFTFES